MANKSRKSLALVLALVFVVALIFPAIAGAAPANTIKVGYNETLKNYLTDRNGNTLYYFVKDDPGVNTCKDQCAKAWPVFYTERISVPPSLDASDFVNITLPDGRMQTTFRGYPMYYFSRDSGPGDIKGDGFNGVWFVFSVLY